MRKHKLRQVVDVAFGVHDDRAVELGQRIQELGGRLNRAKAELAAARTFVVEQAPTALDGEPTAAETQLQRLMPLRAQYADS
ncbi:hypothetical protein ABT373_38915 [Streptomyces sp. NPDC000070]|uniref:hypothetical protein n=1 Tax=Streptomyces sp. NPDC000070 TaxID=3154240 RepID=UPI00331AA09E